MDWTDWTEHLKDLLFSYHTSGWVYGAVVERAEDALHILSLVLSQLWLVATAKEKENKKNYALVLRVSCPEVTLVTSFG